MFVWFFFSLAGQHHYDKIADDANAQKVKQEKRKQDELEKLSPSERAQKVLEEILVRNLKNNYSKKYKQIDMDLHHLSDGIKVNVGFIISDGLLSGIDEHTLINASFNIGKELVNNPNLQVISEIKLSPKVIGKNKYGNDAFDYAGEITLIKSDLNLVNWHQMDRQLFKKYLNRSNYIWINPKYR